MCIHLQLLLISDLLIYKKNIIKYFSRHGLIDESYTSIFSWPSSILCKKDIQYWKRFISSISRNEGLLLSLLRWVADNLRHRRSMAFVSEDRRYIQIICSRQPKVYKQTRLSNKYLLTNNIVNAIYKDYVEVEVYRDHCKVFDLIPPVQVSSPTRSTDVDYTRRPLTT